MTVVQKILDLLRYPSTWKGIVTLLTIAGVTLNPEQSQAIVTVGGSIVGLIMTFLSDSDVKPIQ